MPSKSPAQARFIAMKAHQPNAPKWAKEWNQHDKGTGILRKKKLRRTLRRNR